MNEVARLGEIMLMSLAQTAKYDGLGGARSTSICPSGRADGVGGIQMPWLNQAWQLSTAQPVETWHSQMGGQPVETWQSNGRSDRTLRTAESVDGMRDVEKLHAQQVPEGLGRHPSVLLMDLMKQNLDRKKNGLCTGKAKGQKIRICNFTWPPEPPASMAPNN